MVKIISMSLSEELLIEMNRVQKELGYSGRSEIIRAGVRMLLADNKERERLSGQLDSILMVIHSRKAEVVVTKIKHDFEDIIKTQIHNNLKGDKCLEIFTLNGDARRIKELVN